MHTCRVKNVIVYKTAFVVGSIRALNNNNEAILVLLTIMSEVIDEINVTS